MDKQQHSPNWIFYKTKYILILKIGIDVYYILINVPGLKLQQLLKKTPHTLNEFPWVYITTFRAWKQVTWVWIGTHICPMSAGISVFSSLKLWWCFLRPTWFHIPGCLPLGDWSHHCDYLGHEDLFCTVPCILGTSS